MIDSDESYLKTKINNKYYGKYVFNVDLKNNALIGKKLIIPINTVKKETIKDE